MSKTAAISGEEFAALMTDVGLDAGDPVAVAVSGGADSMALALLSRDWSHGNVTALTFDHRLRAESSDEARQVGEWLADRGIDHQILGWRGARPDSDIQAAARAARYSALEGWCRKNAVASLLLAHHLDDQAETFLIRLARGSGIDGLAAMAPVSGPVSGEGHLPDGVCDNPRLIRPLLALPGERLRVTLNAMGQPWIEDPSNTERSYLRVRVREFLKDTDIDGLDAPRLAKTAAAMRRARETLERLTGEVLSAAVLAHPAGFARVRLAPILDADEEISLRALSRLVACYGGRQYPPRLDAIQRLRAEVSAPEYAGSTLGGVRVEPVTLEGGAGILVCREEGTISEKANLKSGARVHWDGRFLITCEGACGGVSRLGDDGWKEIVAKAPGLRDIDFPHAARLALPALRCDGEIAVVPFIGYDSGPGRHVTVNFVPAQPLFPLSAGNRHSDLGGLTKH